MICVSDEFEVMNQRLVWTPSCHCFCFSHYFQIFSQVSMSLLESNKYPLLKWMIQNEGSFFRLIVFRFCHSLFIVIFHFLLQKHQYKNFFKTIFVTCWEPFENFFSRFQFNSTFFFLSFQNDWQSMKRFCFICWEYLLFHLFQPNFHSFLRDFFLHHNRCLSDIAYRRFVWNIPINEVQWCCRYFSSEKQMGRTTPTWHARKLCSTNW